MASGLNVVASLLIKLGVDPSDVESGMAKAEGIITNRSKAIGAAGKVIGGIASAGFAVAAKGALQAEEAIAHFQASTGASAEEARRWGDYLNAAAGRTVIPMKQIAETSELVRIRFGETGKAGDALADTFLRWQRATGQGAQSVASFEDTIKAWNLTAADTPVVMDKVLAANQKFGGSLDANQAALTALAPSLQAANMTFDEGITLINMFNDAGVDAAAAATGMAKALATVESPEELQAMLVDIASTEDAFERARKASELFGTRAGTKLAQALQRSGGDLSKYALDIEDAIGSVDKAADALDNTFSSKLKLAINGVTSALTGLGMTFGPVLTGMASLVSLAQTVGLGKVFSGLGMKAGGAFRFAFIKAMSVGKLVTPLVDAITTRMGPAMDRAGKLMGGRFGMAFKAAALVGLGLLIVEGIAKLGELRQKNLEIAAANNRAMADLIAEAPSRAEAEKRLAGLRAVPENLDDVQKGVYAFADFAKGNILGSAVDGLFGQNPAQHLEEQVAALEAYIATLPAEVTAAAAPVQAAITAQGNRWAQAGRRSIATLRDAITQGAPAISGAWDVITNALTKGPKIMGLRERMAQAAKAVRQNERMLARAIRAGDAVSASAYADRLLQAKGARRQLLSTNEQTLADAASVLGRQRRVTRKAHRGITAEVDRESRRAARIARRESKKVGAALPDELASAKPEVAAAANQTADVATAPIEAAATDARTYGAHMGQNFASGMYSQIGTVQEASASLAAAARKHIAFSKPPPGPLSTIRSWGPHLVVEWVRPIERKRKDVEKVGRSLAAAVFPKRLRWAEHEWLSVLRRMDKSGKDLSDRQERWLRRFRRQRAEWRRDHPDRSIGGGIGGGGGSIGDTRRMSVRAIDADRLIVRRGGGDEVHIHVGTLVANDAGLDELERRMERRRKLRRRDRRIIGVAN